MCEGCGGVSVVFDNKLFLFLIFLISFNRIVEFNINRIDGWGYKDYEVILTYIFWIFNIVSLLLYLIYI